MAGRYKDYKDLTGFLLGPVRERPAMYLGEAKISSLQNLIFGYSLGFEMAKDENAARDEYFGDNGFLEWFYKTYNVKQTSFWKTPFLDEAENDEKKALEIYFKYLEEFQKWKTNR